MREWAGCVVFVNRWVLGSWKRGRKISSGSSECFPSTSGLTWLRSFAPVPRDFSNSSSDLPEREPKGMTRTSKCVFQESGEKSQYNLVLAGGKMPMVPTEPPAVQASSAYCNRVETITNPSGGRLKVCVHICAHRCFSILGYDPGSQ